MASGSTPNGSETVAGKYEEATQTAIGTEILMLPQIIAGYLAVHEFLSIVENFGRIGYKIPQQLLNKEIFSKVIGGNVTNTTSTSTNDTN